MIFLTMIFLTGCLIYGLFLKDGRKSIFDGIIDLLKDGFHGISILICCLSFFICFWGVFIPPLGNINIGLWDLDL